MSAAEGTDDVGIRFQGECAGDARGIGAKRRARLAAVQFMYQCEVTGGCTPDAAKDFTETYVDRETDVRFLKKLFANFQKDVDLDAVVLNALAEKQNFTNVSLVEKCIVKVATAEMIFEKTDIPVVINEYIEIAKAFVDKNATKFVNALLDKISKSIERRCPKEA